MLCAICGENRFQNVAQKSCHALKNHAEFACPCDKKCMTEAALELHKEEKERNAEPFRCSTCCRSFKGEGNLNSHNRSKDHWATGEKDRAETSSGRFFCHDGCSRSFKTKAGMNEHCRYFRSTSGMDHVCGGCTKAFPHQDRLSQHIKDSGHTCLSRNNRPNYIDKFMKLGKVNVDPEDRKKSVAAVKNVLDPMLRHVTQQPGGHVYSSNYLNAGSHAIKAKIGKAGEFDTNIPMKVDVKDIKTRGQLPYEFEDKVNGNKIGHSPANLNVPRNLVDHPSGEIPIGKARVSTHGNAVPPNLLHKGDLIPHKVQEDFYRKLLKAKEDLNLKDVHISRNAHGPALTATIKQPNGHDINVDLTATLPCKEPVTHNGWPRPDTKKAFSADVINKVKDAGMHLVPKGEVAWTLSYSKAETALLGKIDDGNGCRKGTLKFLKRHMELCASGDGNGLPGMSSHLLKHGLLWSSEKHPDPNNSEYWHQRNIDTCIINTMEEIEGNLRHGKLPNYFDTKENILKGKYPGVCNALADHLKGERIKLIHM